MLWRYVHTTAATAALLLLLLLSCCGGAGTFLLLLLLMIMPWGCVRATAVHTAAATAGHAFGLCAWPPATYGSWGGGDAQGIATLTVVHVPSHQVFRVGHIRCSVLYLIVSIQRLTGLSATPSPPQGCGHRANTSAAAAAARQGCSGSGGGRGARGPGRGGGASQPQCNPRVRIPATPDEHTGGLAG